LIKIYGIHFNRPDFVHLQSRTLKRFLKDDFEFIVVNNANTQESFEAISTACKKESVREVGISRNIDCNAARAYPGYHHSIAMNEIMATEIKAHNDICVILDGDAFLLADYSFSERMCNSSLLGALQHRKDRYWLTPVVLGFKPFELPDFDQINLIGSHVYNPTPEDSRLDLSYYPRFAGQNYVFDCPVCTGQVDNDSEKHIPLDTGGEMYTYLRTHPEVRVAKAGSTSHIKEATVEILPQRFRSRYNESFAFEFYDGKFLHYCRSSNWDHKTNDYHVAKTSLLLDMIEAASSGEEKFEISYQIPNNEWSGWPVNAMISHGVENVTAA
jgi:hypothetical protein